MKTTFVDEAIELLEKANADLQVLLDRDAARRLFGAYARAEKLAAFGVAALARKVDDASHIARMTGMSAGKAKAVVAAGKRMSESDDLSTAMQHGKISLDQAAEIASAEEFASGAVADLVAVAQKEAFHVLKDRARKAKLEAEQYRNLSVRQRAARAARSYGDELGMVHIHLALEPHVGTPIWSTSLFHKPLALLMNDQPAAVNCRTARVLVGLGVAVST